MSRGNPDTTSKGLEEAANDFACFSVPRVCCVNVGWLLTPSCVKLFAQLAVADQAQWRNFLSSCGKGKGPGVKTGAAGRRGVGVSTCEEEDWLYVKSKSTTLNEF